ncbi:MAG: DNA repair protein RadC [Clostridia bacterium]|nr:DNA repair protein RadC [Clostridia bacterium]
MAQRNTHDGHRRRIMSKALSDNFETLEKHELVEVLLFNVLPRVNTNEIAHQLIDKFGSLQAICNADVKDLMSVKGVGLKTAEFLKMLPTYVKCYEFSYYRDDETLANSEKAGEYCVKFFAGQTEEGVYALFLNINKGLIKKIKVSTGTVTAVHIDHKVILKHALETNAAFVILTHNHPSGVLMPSQNDITVTTNIAMMLSNIQTELIDHIIVSGDKYFSFKKENIKIYK